MTLETAAFILLALGILGAHLATLRLLVDCKRDLSHEATNFNGSISSMNEAMMEVIRIGSDMADQLDSIGAGASVASAPILSPKMDLQSTIIDLIASKFLASSNGDQTEQERAIHQENNTTPASLANE